MMEETHAKSSHRIRCRRRKETRLRRNLSEHRSLPPIVRLRCRPQRPRLPSLSHIRSSPKTAPIVAALEDRSSKIRRKTVVSLHRSQSIREVLDDDRKVTTKTMQFPIVPESWVGEELVRLSNELEHGLEDVDIADRPRILEQRRDSHVDVSHGRIKSKLRTLVP